MDTSTARIHAETDTRAVLLALRDCLRARGVEADGPLPGRPSPEWDYLELAGRRQVCVQRDSNGYWQALVFEGREVVRMADVDGGDWPGDPV